MRSVSAKRKLPTNAQFHTVAIRNIPRLCECELSPLNVLSCAYVAKELLLYAVAQFSVFTDLENKVRAHACYKLLDELL